ncbi:IucA/IucC family protein [Streptomyces sp. VNUA116]|uniref:IucA/IucC family protein n=1 Tax=Streptomyces sp. VNUA116 TaxID=3062449 RepID=UPI0026748ED0|nr:IucA/IucC family protein [Streptomyces sp. VNUA116]WKU47396.1 IucA/IucC family protein [Streptomyces sp. VNUA116]
MNASTGTGASTAGQERESSAQEREPSAQGSAQGASPSARPPEAAQLREAARDRGPARDRESAQGREPSPDAQPVVSAVPRQGGAPRGEIPDPGPPCAPDLLEHPDPAVAADAAAVENLLRCWIRETGVPRPDGPVLHLPLTASGTALQVPVTYWSATGWHRLGRPALADAPDDAPAVDAITLAALLGREAAHRAARAGCPATGETADLASRVADSARRTAVFLADRRARPADPGAGELFLHAEQSLLLGHPLHPAPKSREGLSDTEARAYSPELRGSFPLHWLAVHRSLLATDSAWTERGRPVDAATLAARLAGPELCLPQDTVPLPLHPWQAQDIRSRPDIRALLDAGLLHDLRSLGAPWYATSSVRTVYRPGAPAMLKLSLGLRITNSRRENLRKELHRGVEVHRLLRSGLAEQWRAACPGGLGFDVVRDPAWLAADAPDGTPVSGLDTVIRHNPFGPGDDAVCLAGLVSPRPWPATAHGRPGEPAEALPMRSRLARIVARLAHLTGRPAGAVSAEWFLRYLEAVVRPVLWLDGEAGIALEAHQQNTLVLLDRDGWPAGGRYRDNQGYYFRASRRDALDRRLPGIGTRSDTFVSDEVTDERFTYYLGINNILGLIGAFGAQRLADEQLLLAALRRFLREAAAGPAATRSSLPARLLEAPTLRCKANMLTRLRGLDELVGPVDTQSVYVTIANPLVTSAR